MFKQVAWILFSSLLLTGCVTQRDYDQLKSEFAQSKRSAELRDQKIRKEILLFKQAYNPEQHDLLYKNIDESKAYYKKVLVILNDMKQLEKKLKDVAIKAKKNSLITEKNANTSKSKNVVNEFLALKKKWQQTIRNLNDKSTELQNLATKSENAASVASKFSVKAKAAVSDAAKTVYRVNRLNRNIVELQSNIRFMKLALSNLRDQYNPTQHNKEILFELYKNLEARVRAVEKR